MIRRLSLRARFLTFALITLIPLAIVVIFFLDRTADRSYQEVVDSESTLSTLVSQSLVTYVSSHFQTIDRLASIPAVQVQDDPDEVNRILGEARTLRSDMSGVFLVSPNGEVVAQSGTDPQTIYPYVSEDIESVLASGQRSVSHRIDLDDDTSLIVLLSPVTAVTQTQTTTAVPTPTPTGNDDARTPVPTSTTDPDATPGTQPPGAVLAVIGAVIDVDSLNQAVIPVLRTRTEITIVSPEQVITATGNTRDGEADILQIIDQHNIRTGETGTDVFEFQRANGVRRIATYTPVQLDPADWGLVVSTPAPGSYGDSLLMEGALMLALASIAILSFAMVVGEITARPLRDIAADGEKVLQGHLNIVPQNHGTDEMIGISSALASIAGTLSEQQREIEDSQDDRHKQTTQMRELLRRALRLQEDERRRIASEIHDAVSPLITGALYQTRALQMSNGGTTPEKRIEMLQSTNTLLERASEELHGVIFDLRPPDLDDIGVVAAIEAYVSTIQRTGLEARLEVIGELPPQTPEVRLSIYRIVQEALHNVLRHASADEAVVRIEYEHDLLRVTIRDNGAGFDPETAVRPTSLGLMSMRERAAAIGASFSIISRPGAGTAIIIERAETGNVLSDDLFDDLLQGRSDDAQVAENGESSDNGANEDVDPSPTEAQERP
jgi:signal transduction histidine kinase